MIETHTAISRRERALAEVSLREWTKIMTWCPSSQALSVRSAVMLFIAWTGATRCVGCVREGNPIAVRRADGSMRQAHLLPFEHASFADTNKPLRKRHGTIRRVEMKEALLRVHTEKDANITIVWQRCGQPNNTYTNLCTFDQPEMV